MRMRPNTRATPWARSWRSFCQLPHAPAARPAEATIFSRAGELGIRQSHCGVCRATCPRRHGADRALEASTPITSARVRCWSTTQTGSAAISPSQGVAGVRCRRMIATPGGCSQLTRRPRTWPSKAVSVQCAATHWTWRRLRGTTAYATQTVGQPISPTCGSCAKPATPESIVGGDHDALRLGAA